MELQERELPCPQLSIGEIPPQDSNLTVNVLASEDAHEVKTYARPLSEHIPNPKGHNCRSLPDT